MAKKTISIDTCDWCGKALSPTDRAPDRDLDLCEDCSERRAFSEGLAKNMAKNPGRTASEACKSWLSQYD